MADDPARTVASGYDQVADAYAALEREAGDWPRQRHVEELVRLLHPGAHVLDLGCGNGVPVARQLVDAGLRVRGVDVSGEQVRRARAAVPEASFETKDMRTVDLEPDSLDAVVSLYAVEHIPRVEHGALLRRIRSWLREGGSLLLATEDADEEGVVAEWLGAPMYFSTSRADETRRLVRDAGFEIVRSEIETQVEQGVDVPYLWVLARAASHQPE